MKTSGNRLNLRISKPLIVCFLVCLVFLGVASGAAYVLKTVQSVSGACETLAGFPGILQMAGFVPSGNCRFGNPWDDDDRFADPEKDRGKNHQCPPSACSTSDGKKGKCEPDPSNHLCKRHHQPVCVCEVKNESRDDGKDHHGDHGKGNI